MLLNKVNKKDQIWVICVALCYEQPVVLQQIDLKLGLANVDAGEQDQNFNAVAPTLSQVVIVLHVMVVCDH